MATDPPLTASDDQPAPGVMLEVANACEDGPPADAEGDQAALPEEASFMIRTLDKRLDTFLDTLKGRAEAKNASWEAKFVQVSDAIAAVQLTIDQEAVARDASIEQLRTKVMEQMVSIESDIEQQLQKAVAAIESRITELMVEVERVSAKILTGRRELGDVIESRSIAILTELCAFDTDYGNMIAVRRKSERYIAEYCDRRYQQIADEQKAVFADGDRNLNAVRERFRDANDVTRSELDNSGTQSRTKSELLKAAIQSENLDRLRCYEQLLDQIPIFVSRLKNGIHLIS